MDGEKLWKKVLEKIKDEVGPVNFRGWFSNTQVKSFDQEKLVLFLPSAFFKEQLSLRYLDLIEKILKQLTSKKIGVEFEIDSARFFKKAEEVKETLFTPVSPTLPALNPKYSLDNFVVGPSNNVAFAAAQAVVQNPGISYNPLFIYGGTGVGKTHLMIGVGNALLKLNPALKVIYCSSEKFMNDYVEAIQNHKMGEMRNKYRLIDLLLIDDIQFFSGREGTQEEFFHTFNELQSKNAQMIITSDRAPQEIAKLEDRLKSRFQGGLMIDIQPPDFDTRMAILRAKCQQKGEVLPEEVLHLLASSLETNIRELEGKLVQIIQTLKAQQLPFTLENVSTQLGNSPNKPIWLDQKKVLSLVCNYFNLNPKEVIGPRRQKELVLPRHIIMYFLCEELSLTVENVGNILGGRDHTTVMHGRDRIKKLVGTDREVQKMVIDIKQQLLST